MEEKQTELETETSTSVFGDGRISTHAVPTRVQRAGQICERTGHARVARALACALASAQASARGPIVGFWGNFG